MRTFLGDSVKPLNDVATIADLDRVPVKDLVEQMVFQELFIEDLKERSLNICSHVLTKRWVVPDDVSVAVPSGEVRSLCYGRREC